MSRGGARSGSGRKGLGRHSTVDIGAECANRWRALSEKQEADRYARTKRSRDVNRVYAAAKLHEVPLEARRRPAPGAREDLSDDLDAATGGERTRTEDLKRPYRARQELLAEVAEWWLVESGQRISISQVQERWKEYNRVFGKRLKNKGSLKSP